MKAGRGNIDSIPPPPTTNIHPRRRSSTQFMPQRKKVTSEIDFVNHETASATCDQSSECINGRRGRYWIMKSCFCFSLSFRSEFQSFIHINSPSTLIRVATNASNGPIVLPESMGQPYIRVPFCVSSPWSLLNCRTKR